MSCCGQGMTNLMSQFKTVSNTSINIKSHPHTSTSTTTTTTQQLPQNFSTFTKGGFMKFTRPSK